MLDCQWHHRGIVGAFGRREARGSCRTLHVGAVEDDPLRLRLALPPLVTPALCFFVAGIVCKLHCPKLVGMVHVPPSVGVASPVCTLVQIPRIRIVSCLHALRRKVLRWIVT